MKAAIYTRVSTNDKDQNPKVQEELLRPWVESLGYVPVLFQEEGVSGAKTSRPALDRMLVAAKRRNIQAVAVWRLDRLGRSLVHLLVMLQELQDRGIRLLIHDQGVDTGTPHGKLLFSVVGAFSEYERSLMAERIRDGMTYAKVHGTRSGRPVGRPGFDKCLPAIRDALLKLSGRRGAVTIVAREFDVSPAWLYKHVIPGLKVEGLWS